MAAKLFDKMLTVCLFFSFISGALPATLPRKFIIEKYLQNPAIKRFQEYVQIDTSKPENLNAAVAFWERQAEELELPFVCHEPAGLPVCVLTWAGTDPALPSIMLNTHMDVVPVEPEEWKYPPFAAHMDDNGDIYGRGTQDTKDVAIQYLEAIRQLKDSNVELRRTLHITLMPDEETGGFNGMVPFIETEEFKALNIGFALDEGISSTTDVLFATYVDRRPWQMKITVRAEGGHGSSMPDGSAIQKANKLMNAVLKYREKQRAIMLSREATDFGAYTSINVNMIAGGLMPNVIPSHVTVVVDMRLSTAAKVENVEKLVNSWLVEAGNGTTVEFLRQTNRSAATAADDSNPYWRALQAAADTMGIKIVPVVCPATSDMVPIRNLGIPGIGLTAKTHTVSRIHAAGEYLNAETFLRGIDFYAAVIKSLGDL